jgi:hypothetical protein
MPGAGESARPLRHRARTPREDVRGCPRGRGPTRAAGSNPRPCCPVGGLSTIVDDPAALVDKPIDTRTLSTIVDDPAALVDKPIDTRTASDRRSGSASAEV